jgi:PBP1b-binding outer membrane lipoprotein LpoB
MKRLITVALIIFYLTGCNSTTTSSKVITVEGVKYTLVQKETKINSRMANIELYSTPTDTNYYYLSLSKTYMIKFPR